MLDMDEWGKSATTCFVALQAEAFDLTKPEDVTDMEYCIQLCVQNERELLGDMLSPRYEAWRKLFATVDGGR